MLRSFSGGCFLSIVKPIIIIIIIIIVIVIVIVIVTITITIIIIMIIINIKAMQGLAKNSALDILGLKIARDMLVELCRALAHLN